MSPFERARSEARKARDELWGDAANGALNVSSLQNAIEKFLGLGVEKVAPGSISLGGGRACLNTDQHFIYLSSEESDEDAAELLAHELGHFKLDPPGSAVSVASLKKLPENHGSLAMAKVEAYGARERSELLANVFARELLLPRSIARELFLEGLGPRQMGNELGIPLRVARLQTIDAVLLPVAGDELATKPFTPTEDQVAAARAQERFVNVVAGPGTGKTSTLIDRIRYLIEEQGVDPTHILALTFTNKAAWEVAERLRISGIKGASNLWAGTFHAYGLEFLRKYHPLFGLESDFQIVDTLGAVGALVKELPKLDLKHYKRVHDPYIWLDRAYKAITRLKEDLISPAEYRSRCAKLREESADLRNERDDIATLYEVHEAINRRYGTVDFVDLVARPTVALQADPAPYADLARRHQYILVDEYQDVTEAMRQLVLALTEKAQSLWIVGDVRQAIHHWRGASIRSLTRFKETYEAQSQASGAKIREYPLSNNHRSTEEIIALVNRSGTVHELQDRLPLVPTQSFEKKTGPVPTLIKCVDQPAVEEVLSKAISWCEKKGIPLNRQAILARGRADIESASRSLRAVGVPTLYIGELAHWTEVKSLLLLMQLLCERRPRALVGISDFLNLDLSADAINYVLTEASTNVSWQRDKWLSKDDDELGLELAKAARAIRSVLGSHSRYSSPFDFLCDILFEKRTILPKVSNSTIDASLRRLALWQFITSVHVGDSDGAGLSLPRFLARQQLRQRLGDTYADRELPPEASALDAVRVMTIHGSKGLEFDAVHLLGVSPWNFGGSEASDMPPWESIQQLVPPSVLNSTTEQYQFENEVEKNNLFYVAVSRPRKQLFLYTTDWYPIAQLKVAPPVHRTKDYKEDEPLKECGTGSAIMELPGSPLSSFEEFETYIRCPLQHKYRFEMKLGGARDVDVAIVAQGAIRSALGAIAAKPALNLVTALQQAWVSSNLPTAHDDPHLWRDAEETLAVALAAMIDFDGSLLTMRSELNTMNIPLPGISLVSHKKKMVRVVGVGQSKDLRTATRPLLSGLSSLSGYMVETYDALYRHSGSAQSESGRVTSTNVWKATVKYLAQDQSPKQGHHCNQCSFITICPAVPS